MHIETEQSSGSTTLFVSARERRLWLLVLLLVATIYATLELAAELAGSIDRRVFDNLFMVGFVVALVAIAAVGWKLRLGSAEIGVGLAVLAVYLMVVARIGTPAERTHLFEYGIVALLIHQALLERHRSGGWAPLPVMVAVLLTIGVGWIDEAIQAVLPGRVYDLRDVGFNALAAALAVGASATLAWLRRSRMAAESRR